MPKRTHCLRGHELTEENRKNTKSGSKCRTCDRARNRDFLRRDPHGSAYRGRITYQMRTRYGIQSIDERDALLVSQDNACAICGRTDCVWGKGFNDVWHIDHPHDKPGTHRGILCARCNTALGRLEPNWEKVVAYLKLHSQ